MNTRQLSLLFFCNLIPFTLGQAIFSLMPVYATRLGASSAESGNILASGFAALTVGTISAGWLFNRVKRPCAILIVCGLVDVPATFLLGQVSQVWQLLVLLTALWLLTGIAISTVTIIAGVDSGESERGKIFGILGTAVGVGGLIGGGVSGPIADRLGYSALFSVLAPWYLLQALAATFIIVRHPSQAASAAGSIARSQPLGLPFYLLFLSGIAASIPTISAVLARALQMDRLNYDAAAISGIFSFSSAVSIPTPLLLGWLSDRLGRYRMLAICMFLALIGTLLLGGSTLLWQFGLSGALLSIAGAVTAVGTALVADLVPIESLSTALARFGATSWIGGVMGLMSTGYLIQALGFVGACTVGAFLAVLALVLLFGVYRNRPLRVALRGT